MANKKFSEFTVATDENQVSSLVGYNGSDNVQITPALLLGTLGPFLPLTGGTLTGPLVVDSTATVNDILTAGLGLAVTGGTVGSGKLVLASTNKVHLSGGSAGLILQNSGGTKSLTIDDTLSTFVGLVSGITPVDAANFVTKAYLDGGGGAGNGFLPLAGGTMLGNTIHNDNVKSIYGTANDGLEIFHDSSNSFISDTGTGDLYISASTNFFVRNRANDEVWIKATDAGVSLRHQDTQKLITTSTGISVTGNVILGTADSLYLNGTTGVRLLHDGSNALFINQTVGDFVLQNSVANKNIIFKVVNSEKMRLDPSGKLALGTSIPSSDSILTLSTASSTGLSINSVSNLGESFINFGDSADVNAGRIYYGHSDNAMRFRTNDALGMILTSAGLLGLGVSNPSVYTSVAANNFVFGSSSNSGMTILSGTTTFGNIAFADGEGTNDQYRGLIQYGHTLNSMQFFTNAAEKMRLDSSGNLGIGTTAQSGFKLDVNGAVIARGSAYVQNDLNHFGSTDFTINASATTTAIKFVTGAAERMRLTSAGALLIGTTGVPNGTSIYGSGFIDESDGRATLYMATSRSTAATLQVFFNPNGPVGSINTTGSATSYSTSSDYRLKEDLQDFEGLDLVSKIPVYDFKWKVDESRSY